MSQIVSQFDLGIISIVENYDLIVESLHPNAAPTFGTIGQELVVSFIQLKKVEKFTKFSYESIGTTNDRYLETYYRVSRNGNSWTNYLPLNSEINNFPPFSPLDSMYIDIKFVRVGNKEDGDIKLKSYNL